MHSGLKEWLQVHRFELYDVLQPAGRHILFGEWCYAVHSLEYKALSDTFLAFDVYDREEGCFYSIKRRNEFLAETSIRTVPLIRSSTFRTVAELLPLLDTPSAFRGDGEPVEGLVLRVDSDEQEDSADVPGKCLRRTKLVRPDFVQGITEHWMARKLKRNTVKLG